MKPIVAMCLWWDHRNHRSGKMREANELNLKSKPMNPPSRQLRERNDTEI
jgi:hypothetical protein